MNERNSSEWERLEVCSPAVPRRALIGWLGEGGEDGGVRGRSGAVAAGCGPGALAEVKDREVKSY